MDEAVGRCATCVKREGERCAVLTVLLGLEGKCWAWSDDPRWEAKADFATARYAERKGPAAIREFQQLLVERLTRGDEWWNESSEN